MIDIDLNRHGVIEASAGTGKTHTLIELVLRLLSQEKQVRLDEILLVTYTEKATGELKGRLRRSLELACEQKPEQRRRFQAALDSFEQAHVYTIHGFCQRALQDFALENRHELRLQLVDDRELLEICLRELQRKHWRQDYGERLREVLDLAGYSSSTGGGEGWEKRVRQLALSYRSGCKHLLRPLPLSDWPRVLWEREKAVRASICRWREFAAPFTSDKVEEHQWSIGFRQLDHSARIRDSRHDKLLLPLLRLLAGAGLDRQPLLALQQFLRDCREVSSFEKYGFLLLTDSLSSKAQAQLDRLCPNLCKVVNDLEKLRQEEAPAELKHQLSIRTVLQLQDHLSAYKRERGLQSFEDMLTGLEESLDPERSPQANALCACLRKRFQCAVVDEFQDTDPIQWSIFKRIFVEGTSQHALFVVGDPKQAIFGFRGADLHAYLAASKELKEGFQGASYPLNINWRSCPELIESLNDVFEKGHWFSETGIEFSRVGWPDNEDERNRIISDRTGRPALCAVDLSEHERLVLARRQNACFIAAEIRRLLANIDGKPALEVQEKGKEARALNAGDICILVYKRKEATPILSLLREAGIPYSFYKQPGLWQSAEAIHLDYLLRALARPDDTQAFHKALLTRFYSIRPGELSCCEQIPPGHEVRRLFERWVELAEKRDWARLFQSLLEDTGVLFRDMKEADGERRLANFRHILQTLEQSAYGQDLDLLGVLELLRGRRYRGADDESDLQPVETEQSKVKIMTVHASKGLEFPVVFLAGGFTTGHRKDCTTYRDDNRLVFDLCPDDKATADARREQDHEDRRLLYVALTRAIFKLYLPRVDAQKKYHQAGPVATILAPALELAKIETLKWAPAVAGELPAEPIKKTLQVQPKVPALLARDELFPLLPGDLSRRRILIRSFSSIHRGSPFQPREVSTFGEESPRTDDEKPDVLPAEDSLRGTAFGSLVHDVLERIRFGEVGEATAPENLLKESAPARLLIDERVDWYLPELASRLRDEELRALCRRQVAQLVWNTLHTPLAYIGGPLWQIPEQDRLQELEFHFPEWEDAPPAEVAFSEGFFTGFMDLVFRKNGKYFLADWKTNALPGYSPQHIAESMRESDYHRQYQLYLHALRRWLKRVHGNAFDFACDFGGVYYLYLRGMNARDESSGVFFCRPPVEDSRLECVTTIA